MELQLKSHSWDATLDTTVCKLPSTNQSMQAAERATSVYLVNRRVATWQQESL